MDKEALDLVFAEHLQQCTRDIIERCILLTRKGAEDSKMKREGDKFTCDRCGAKEFVEEDGKKPTGWFTLESILIKPYFGYLHLCPNCARKYKEMLNQFWENKENNTCEENC